MPDLHFNVATPNSGILARPGLPAVRKSSKLFQNGPGTQVAVQDDNPNPDPIWCVDVREWGVIALTITSYAKTNAHSTITLEEMVLFQRNLQPYRSVATGFQFT